MSTQPDLFSKPPVAPTLPAGFKYQTDFVTAREEAALVGHLSRLEFKEFEFQGFLGKRRTVSFGWRYDFNGGGLKKSDDIPDFLLPLRERAAVFAGVAAADLQQVLLIEYRPGAAIGWHRDRPIFDKVIGVSLGSPCMFRLRRKAGEKWHRASLIAEPRSIYLLSGPARTEWEHSIPGVDALRYSITMRTFKDTPAPRSAT
jgi:alkylated DNA repair dioxygenase AlkB